MPWLRIIQEEFVALSHSDYSQACYYIYGKLWLKCRPAAKSMAILKKYNYTTDQQSEEIRKASAISIIK